ncbi:nuclear transport factor 2 family protein [Granulicoccus phenolivorans]|uniref:nuclear transport factor 2 family protein n=1 Tax=Granulicoccus phenolivorans TaxID=266854 RepID=UPI00041A31A5|nr:nuclear transport factor 2 family protein [Granulicoccus phenolivorans]
MTNTEFSDTDLTRLAARLQRVEDRLAIQDLVQLYGYVMDERDLSGLPQLFTADAELHSEDGVFNAIGLDTITETYGGRYDQLGATYHWANAVITRFDAADPDVAYGLVNGGAEVVRNGETMKVALRYKDTYRRTPEGWRFAIRTMSYAYYIREDEYIEGMKGADRNRCYGDRREADWPAVLHNGELDWLRAYYRQAGDE